MMSTRTSCLAKIKSQCYFTEGFEEAFAHIGMFTLKGFTTMIEEHIPIRVCGYTEWVDFLDGNGFSVKNDGGDWYVITPLNT